MRFVIAMMKHETNTFSPVPTTLKRFSQNSLCYGSDAYRAFKGTNMPIGAFIDLAEGEKAEIVIPIAADAWPSGPVDARAYNHITGCIGEAVAKGCDAVFLDLHGAMVAENTDDGEGTLLNQIRSLAPELPIAVALDLHANLTDQMIENCNVIAGYNTYPHVDMYQTGIRCGKTLIDMLKKKIKPAMAWANPPMLPHIMRMSTDYSPMKDLAEMAKAIERQEALLASVFGGFPLADIRNAGFSAVVVTNGNQELAEKICKTLADAAWQRRNDFVYQPEPLADSVSRAKKLSVGPILLIDHADNCGSGGTQDTMEVVAEVMRQELENVAVGAIRDPEAVTRLIEIGVGNPATILVGGKMDMPSIGRRGKPLQVSGKVRVISDGDFIITGPMYTGARMQMGKSVVLDTGKIQLLIIENNIEPFDLGMFRSVGIEPTAKRYLLLKSKLHYRAGFLPIAKQIVECDGMGVTSSDYRKFKFSKIRRPIFPLDADLAL